MIDLQWYPVNKQSADLSGKPLLGELSNLAKRRVSWKTGGRLGELTQVVGTLRKTYGPLREKENDTLEGWLTLAALTRLHLNLYRALVDGGPQGFVECFEYRYNELKQRQSVDFETFKMRYNFAQRQDLTTKFPDHPELKGAAIFEKPIFKNRDMLEEAELNHLEVLRELLVQGGNRRHTRTIKRALANGLYDIFGAIIYHRPGERLLIQHWGARALCSVDTWLYAALSALWRDVRLERDGYGIKTCAACSSPFPKFHGATKYCKPSCAGENLRAKRRA